MKAEQKLWNFPSKHLKVVHKTCGSKALDAPLWNACQPWRQQRNIQASLQVSKRSFTPLDCRMSKVSNGPSLTPPYLPSPTGLHNSHPHSQKPSSPSQKEEPPMCPWTNEWTNRIRGLCRCKILCTVKETVNRVKRQTSEWKKAPAKLTSNKGLMFKLYEIQLSKND